MQQTRKPKEWRVPFFRFRLAITFLPGLRADTNEVADVQHEQIRIAIEHGHLDVLLSKTRKRHRYVLTQAARNALDQLRFESREVFALHSCTAGTLRGAHWVRFLNLRLQPAVVHFGLNLKSHSFRVGYITHLLQHAPVQHAACIVGHQDIRSTLAYNRYVPQRDEIIKLLERDE